MHMWNGTSPYEGGAKTEHVGMMSYTQVPHRVVACPNQWEITGSTQLRSGPWHMMAAVHVPRPRPAFSHWLAQLVVLTVRKNLDRRKRPPTKSRARQNRAGDQRASRLAGRAPDATGMASQSPGMRAKARSTALIFRVALSWQARPPTWHWRRSGLSNAKHSLLKCHSPPRPHVGCLLLISTPRTWSAHAQVAPPGTPNRCQASQHIWALHVHRLA